MESEQTTIKKTPPAEKPKSAIQVESVARQKEYEPRAEIQVQPVPPSPMSMMALIIEKNLDSKKLQAWMDFVQRVEESEAKKAYFRAMAAFKKEPPEILKTLKVDYGTGDKRVNYMHADLANAAVAIGESLSQHGLFADWNMKQENKEITVECTITHELGYSKSVVMTAPPDTSGGKDSIKAIASTNTYLQRYTLFAITGLAAKGMDDDGRGGGSELVYLTDKHARTLQAVVEEIGDSMNLNKFLGLVGAESIATILESDYKKAATLLQDKKTARKK